MKRIEVITDGNILEFRETKVVNKATLLVYEYVESETKLGQTLKLCESDFDKMIKNGIAKII